MTIMDKVHPECYAVVDIATNKRLYCGWSAMHAAIALVPNTCHGKGPTREIASKMAHARAEVFRIQQRLRS